MTTSATDPRAGFPGVTFLQGTVQGVQFPGAFPSRLKAVHMALIPKGPNQGKLLVWDIAPIIGAPPPGQTSPTNLFAYQPFAIVDPDPAANPRFLNFLLPIEAVTNPGPGQFQGGDMFCSGHVWSPFGDLVVVGGTSFIPQAGGLTQFAAKKTWVFDPNAPSSTYAGQLGRWFPGPDLRSSRYYPTAVLTGAMPNNRLNGHHAVLVLGGESRVGGGASLNLTWNLYEALEIVSAPSAAAGSGLITDTFTNAAGSSGEWPGPASPSNSSWLSDSLYFYPRCHLLTNGKVFMSGMAPLSAALDHVTTNWDLFPGHAPSPVWNLMREYGASIHYPNIGGINNMIVRIGGGDSVSAGANTTQYVDACVADDPSASWFNTYPLNVPRSVLNVAILPDASILALGGVNVINSTTSIPQFNPEIYRPGAAQWQLLPRAVSARDYHSTAMLLPDGRVIVGGGEHRILDFTGGFNGFDYEIFSPPYLAGPDGTVPIRPQILSIAPQNFDTNDRVYDLARNAIYSAQIAPLPLGMSVERAVLMAPGSTTHHSDMSQRYHLLTTKPMGPTQVNFTTPTTSTILPAGIFMLFLVSNTGIPSRAVWVRLP